MPIVDPSQLLSLNINYWVLQTIAMLVTAFLIPGLTITNPLGALATVVALGFMNSKIWDAALFFSIPNTFSSQALSLFFVNGLLFWIVVKLLPGIEVSGILPALVAPVVFTVSSMLISEYGSQINWIEVFNYLVEKFKFYKQLYFNSPGIQSSQ